MEGPIYATLTLVKEPYSSQQEASAVQVLAFDSEYVIANSLCVEIEFHNVVHEP